MNDLWLKAQKGNKEAEEKVFRELRVRLALIARLRVREEDVEDIVQEACLTALSRYKSVSEPYRFEAWVHKILRNKIRNHYRTTKRFGGVPWDVNSYDDSIADPSLERDPDLLRRITECVQKLIRRNRKYARVLNLSRQGYKVQEICEKLGVTRGHLYVMLNRSREYLHNCIYGKGASNGR